MWIIAQTKIHACFVIFQFGASCEYATKRNLQRNTVIEGQRRLDCKLVEFAHPLMIYTSRSIACKGGVNIAICQNDSSGFERRYDVMFRAVGKVGGMDEAEGGGGQQLLFLAFAGCLLYQRRGVPFAKEHRIPLADQPLTQQGNLGAFP